VLRNDIILIQHAIGFVIVKCLFRLSTFSGYIGRMRGYSKKIKDKEVYFTDTLYPDAYKGRGFDKKVPSWQDWTSIGLFGREYPEVCL